MSSLKTEKFTMMSYRYRLCLVLLCWFLLKLLVLDFFSESFHILNWFLVCKFTLMSNRLSLCMLCFADVCRNYRLWTKKKCEINNYAYFHSWISSLKMASSYYCKLRHSCSSDIFSFSLILALSCSYYDVYIFCW